MESMVFDDRNEKEKDFSEEELLEEGEISPEEEAFMRGYADEEEVITCAECGVAIRSKPLTRNIEGNTYKFCSEMCAQEFEESLG